MEVKLKNNVGMIKIVPQGFSWTTFFFGCFVPLFRGDIKWCAIMVILGLLTGGISHLFFPFFYNKIYTKSLLEQGYQAVSDEDKKILKMNGIQFAQ